MTQEQSNVASIEELYLQIAEINELLVPVVMEPGMIIPLLDRMQAALRTLLASKQSQLNELLAVKFALDTK